MFNYINQRITELDAKKKNIERSIHEKQLLSNEETDILELAKIWSEDEFEKKKLIAKTLIKEVRIIEREVEIIWNL